MKSHWKKTAFLVVAVGGYLASFLVFLLVPAHSLLADIQNSEIMTSVAESSGLATDSLPILIAKIIRFSLGVLGVLVVLIIIYCGWLYMTAHGEKTNVEKAQKIFRNAAIGLLLIFGSFAITSFILSKLLEAANLGGVSSTGAVNYSEPLSVSLGSGIIENHYPARGAVNIPRNTRIMVTFKEPIAMDSIIDRYNEKVDGGITTFNLNTSNILIYQTNDVDEGNDITAAEVALASTDVVVTFNGLDYDSDGTVDPDSYKTLKTEGTTTFVFDPPLLGNADTYTNYTVFLGSDILKASGSKAFIEDDGYQWTFTVSTEIDLTPPHVVSVSPVSSSSEKYPRNTIIQINFNEAMDPVASTGTYHIDLEGGSSKTFTNIAAKNTTADEIVAGTYSISNSYRTIEFVSEDPCGSDPCGNTIYCLPGSAALTVTAKAASLSDEPPQASTTGGLFDCLADAAGNSLDGSGPLGVYDGVAKGPSDDNYVWGFSTSSVSDTTVPTISTISPSPANNESVGLDQNLVIDFNIKMWSATLNSSNVQIVPNHDQGLWYLTENSLDIDHTETTTSHAAFWETEVDEEGNKIFFYYYPVITQGVRGLNQICMSPAQGPDASGAGLCISGSGPNCCDGAESSGSCKTMGDTGIYKKASTTLGQ